MENIEILPPGISVATTCGGGPHVSWTRGHLQRGKKDEEGRGNYQSIQTQLGKRSA
jgi:hypothetical protein